MNFPPPIQKLIQEFTKLPTVGPKTAERYVFYLLKQSPEKLQEFAQYIVELREKITICSNCLSIAESNPCSICSDVKRDKNTLCIVSDSRDMLVIENTRQYNGLFFILGGEINTIMGIKPENLNIKKLVQKTNQEKIQEIILALNPTIEGETTAMYLTKLLKPLKIKITRIARGLPMGSDIEYADEMTITNALKYRNEV
jgi:recombination protein RecR